MAWEARLGLKQAFVLMCRLNHLWLNGLGSPSGIETTKEYVVILKEIEAKWPGKPVWD